jgi:hypothetical protein
MTDTNGDGHVNAADCAGPSASPSTVCSTGVAMPDRNNDGQIDAFDCPPAELQSGVLGLVVERNALGSGRVSALAATSARLVALGLGAGPLPVTGAGSTWTMVALALGLLFTGAALVRIGRRPMTARM